MATKIATIYSLITADDAPLKRGLASAHSASVKGATRIQTALGKINFKAIGVGALAIGASVAMVASKFIKLAIEQERMEIRLGAVLKSTGQAAGYNLDQLKEMASAMQGLTTVGDETILGGMSLLATFKLIRGEAFERSTMSALDLSEVLQTDLKSAMIQIGKAMNDPIANLSAMSRAGIQFTKDQKLTIKTLWEAGRQAEAQSLILDELESQFGGTAKAARNTFGGALKVLQNSLGDTAEQMGSALFPELKRLTKQFGDWADENHRFIRQNIPAYIGQIAKSMGNMVDASLKLVAVSSSFPPGTLGAMGAGIIGGLLFGGLGPGFIVGSLAFIAQEVNSNAKVYKDAFSKTIFGDIILGFQQATDRTNELLRWLGVLDKYSMKVGTGMRDALSWKQKGDSGGTGITTGGGFEGGKEKPAPPPPAWTLLKADKKVIPVLTDMWATYYDKQTQQAAEAATAKAEVLNSIYPESNKKTVMVLTDMWATYNTEQVQAAAAMSAEKAETLRLWEEENKKTSGRMLQLSERTAWAMQESFSDVFYDQMKGKLESFKDYFSAFLDTMQRAWADIMGQMMTQWIFGQDMKGGGMLSQAWSFISGALGGVSGGGNTATSLSSARWSPRAAGGPVSVGSPYLVGERGPELFVPNKSGNIIPDKNLAGGGGGRGDTYNVYNITANDAASFVDLARRSGAVPLLAAENLADNGSLRKAIAESL